MLWEQGVEGSNPFAPTTKKGTFSSPFFVFNTPVLFFRQVNDFCLGGIFHHRSDAILHRGFAGIHLT